MKPEAATFVKQLLGKLEQNVSLLEQAKQTNDSNKFNEIKKECFKIHEEIGKLL